MFNRHFTWSIYIIFILKDQILYGNGKQIYVTSLLVYCSFSVCFCCSGRIPRLSFNQHSLYVVVVEKPPPPTTHRGAVRKDGAEIPRGWSLPECFTSSGGVLTSPFILNNSVETTAPFNVVFYPRLLLFSVQNYIYRICSNRGGGWMRRGVVPLRLLHVTSTPAQYNIQYN